MEAGRAPAQGGGLLGVKLALALIPAPVMAESRRRAAEVMAGGKPVNWAAAAVIVGVWLLLAALVVAALWRAWR